MRPRFFILLLVLGIALRIITFWFLAPSNYDHHEKVIAYLLKFHALPQIPEEHEAHNPPLYYLIAAIPGLTGRLKVVQGLSLAFSIATLVALFHLITRGGIIVSQRAQTYSLLIACFLPQFVLFSLYVSNDTLAIFLGSLAAIVTWRYIQVPSWRTLTQLSIVVGVGLLTKTTFVVLIPELLILVCWYPRDHRPRWNAIMRACAFAGIVILLGGYKFADNLVRYGDPFFSNMDLGEDWSITHEQTYRGLASFLDANVGNLIASPIVDEAKASAYPVLLYGTFWYPHIPEGSFNHGSLTRLRYVGSAIFLMALLPSALFFLGLGELLYGLPSLIRAFDPSRQEDLRKLAQCVFALTIAFGIVLLNATAIRHHEWSIFQGRFLFPFFFAGAVAFSEGVEPVVRSRRGQLGMAICMGILIALFGAFFGSEIAWAAQH